MISLLKLLPEPILP